MSLPTTIQDLKKAAYNPRKIDEDSSKGLNASLASFGDLSGIVVNLARESVIVAGHQRCDQLIALGASPIQWGETVAVGDETERRGITRLPNGETFTVRGVFWPEWKEKAANLAANNPHIQGRFTSDLVPLLDELKPQLALLMPQLGDPFVSLKLGDMMPAYAKKKELRGDPNEIPEPPKELIVQLGDVWQLGDHRLVCGSCKRPAVIDALFKDTPMATVFATDPPYGVDYNNELRPSNKGVLKRKTAAVADDDLTPEQLVASLRLAFETCVPVLGKHCAVYCWYPDVRIAEFTRALEEGLKFKRNTTIVWDKQRLIPTFWHYASQHELCLFGHLPKGKPRKLGNDAGEKNQTTVWYGTRVTKAERDEMDHSTPKPFELWEIPMEMHMRPAEVMFDPFSGSGPGLVACEKGGRVFRGIDLKPKNVATMISRWEKLSGGKAEFIERLEDVE